MKRIMSMILAVVLVMGAFVIFPVSSASAASYKDSLINSILEYESDWYSKSFFKDKGYYGYGTAEFIDYNFDGKPEFSITYPSLEQRLVFHEVGQYKYGHLEAVAGDENSGNGGYFGNELTPYYIKSTGTFMFLGKAMLYEDKNAWLQQNFAMDMTDNYGGFLNVSYFSGKLYIDGETTYFGKSNAYCDLDGAKAVSSKKYKSINNDKKSGLVKASMSTKKINLNKWYSYSQKKKKDLLSASYDAFKLSASILSTPALPTYEAKDNGVLLKWKAVSGAVNYRVYRKSKKADKWKSVGTTSKPQFTDTTVEKGKSYIYTIRCISANGKYAVSPYNKTGKTIKYLKTPQITKLGSAKDGVKITWGKVSGAEKYRVYVKKDGKWKTVSNTTSTSVVHKDVQSNQSYTYTVRCISSSGKTYTSVYDKNGKSITYIASPVLSKVENTTSGVKVSWKAVTGAQNYRVYVKGGEYKSWTKVADTTSTSLTDKKAQSGVKYTYTVACMSEDGKTRISSFDSKGKAITYIEAPVIESTTQSSTGIKLTWSKVSGAAKYRVFVKSGSSWKKLKDTTSTSFTHKGLTENTEYTYTVRCISETGKSYTSAYYKDGWTVPYMMVEPTEPPTQPQTEPATQGNENVVEATQIAETVSQEPTE